jgi:hypothetical protein
MWGSGMAHSPCTRSREIYAGIHIIATKKSPAYRIDAINSSMQRQLDESRQHTDSQLQVADAERQELQPRSGEGHRPAEADRAFGRWQKEGLDRRVVGWTRRQLPQIPG